MTSVCVCVCVCVWVCVYVCREGCASRPSTCNFVQLGGGVPRVCRESGCRGEYMRGYGRCACICMYVCVCVSNGRHSIYKRTHNSPLKSPW